MKIFLRLLGLALCLSLPGFAASKVVAVNVNGIIHPITAEILQSAIDYAQEQEAELLLIRLNTPGGLLDATRNIVEIIVASPIPTVSYVTPSGGRAASAGFFLLQAADVAAMAPGTNTGAASPVLPTGEMDATMRKKVENDAAASLRSLAAKRKRNAELAEKTVREAVSFTEEEALENDLIEFVAASEQDLFEKLSTLEIQRFNGSTTTLALSSPTVEDYPLSMKQRIIQSIANPNVALILLALGALGVYAEFSAPGLIFPGVAGAILVLLGLTAISVFPINWLGVSLMVLALVLFVLEANIPSSGILGIGGAVALTLGALLLIDSPIPEVRIRLGVALAIAVPFAAITIFLVSLIVRSERSKVTTGEEGLVGEVGVARTPLDPRGKIFVHGEYWDAVSPVRVELGQEVRVLGVDGLILRVEPASAAQPAA